MSVTLQKIFELNNGKHCSRSQDDQLIEPVQFRQNRIVSAIIFKDDQVVLVSETKHDGKWYLPAGKVKASETLHVGIFMIYIVFKIVLKVMMVYYYLLEIYKKNI